MIDSLREYLGKNIEIKYAKDLYDIVNFRIENAILGSNNFNSCQEFVKETLCFYVDSFIKRFNLTIENDFNKFLPVDILYQNLSIIKEKQDQNIENEINNIIISYQNNEGYNILLNEMRNFGHQFSSRIKNDPKNKEIFINDMKKILTNMFINYQKKKNNE